MRLSARNQLNVTVRDVELGAVMAEVTVDVAGQKSWRRSPVPPPSALASLRAGRPVTVLIKATEVILGVDEA